jgi:hypothetical protein
MSAGQQTGGGIATCRHCGTTHGGGHKTLEHIACLQARLDAALGEVVTHKEHRKVLARDLSALIDGREPTTDLANGVAQRIKRVQAELTEERRAHELAKGVVRAASKHLSIYEVQSGSTPTEETLYSAVAAYGAPDLWIRCSERMPDADQEVWTVIDGNVLAGKYDVAGYFNDEEGCWPADRVRHWMPRYVHGAPTPPSGESDG